MDPAALAAAAKQAFSELVSMCAPEAVVTWRPRDEQRLRYVQLAEKVLNDLDALDSAQRRHLLAKGEYHAILPEHALSFLRAEIEPRVNALRAALDHLDPDGKALRDMLLGLLRPRGAQGRVLDTFEEGVRQIDELLERNPDWEEEARFLPDAARDVIESRLIRFEPDAWLDRTGTLAPIRTAGAQAKLPAHVRFRLEELYRALVFGLWLSALALTRAILEYAILDNLYKFGIDERWPADAYGKRREKKLSDLIDELARALPSSAASMSLIRDYGNEYLHPKMTRTSKEALLRREASASTALESLLAAVELLYDAPNKRAGQVR
jgi:hypothetical protein